MESERRVCIELATEEDRETIYRMRHTVYASELGQHRAQPDGRLQDALDVSNVYIIARAQSEIVGFVSLTPPDGASYSMDKYLPRGALPFPFDNGLYEIRLLTVDPAHRGTAVALLLVHAAVRWAESRGATRLMAIGRREIMPFYRRIGARPLGIQVQSGAVDFEVITVVPADWNQTRINFATVLARLQGRVDWRLDVPLQAPAPCFHGGAFFDAVGDEFQSLDRSRQVINADVLDAWFPPSPRVLEAVRAYLPWLIRTSPPTGGTGLARVIARVRGIPVSSVLLGAGSSSLIFLAFRSWLTPASRVLLLDPTYGEYAHVLERVVGCQVDRLTLSRACNYDLDPSQLAARLGSGYDLVVLVNPNSPTGRHVQRSALITALEDVPGGTRIWIDETYVDYAGGDQSLEAYAAERPNVVVCKSMSKVYALSGLRVAYLCAAPAVLEPLRAITPPWAVGSIGQAAAIHALQDPDYYAARYVETHILRESLTRGLTALALQPLPGVANFVLCHLLDAGPDAATVVARCQRQGLFLRDGGPMGTRLGCHVVRIAVKDAATNERMLSILGAALDQACHELPG